MAYIPAPRNFFDGGNGPTSCFSSAPATLSPRLRLSSGLKGVSATCECHKRIESSSFKVGERTKPVNHRRCVFRLLYFSSCDRRDCYVRATNHLSHGEAILIFLQ